MITDTLGRSRAHQGMLEIVSSGMLHESSDTFLEGAVKAAQRDGKLWLTLDDTKDDLKNAPGFKYD